MATEEKVNSIEWHEQQVAAIRKQYATEIVDGSDLQATQAMLLDLADYEWQIRLAQQRGLPSFVLKSRR
jgi:hypothetical protein